jgi:hypothetical protein
MESKTKKETNITFNLYFYDFLKEFVEIFLLIMIVTIITDRPFDLEKLIKQSFLITILLNIIQYFNKDTKDGIKSGITYTLGSLVLGH